MRGCPQHAFQACAIGQLGESSVEHLTGRLPDRQPVRPRRSARPGAGPDRYPAHGPGRRATLHLDPSCGVHPANSPRAGRQQGHAGSGGCAGGPSLLAGPTRREPACRWRSTASTDRPPSPRSGSGARHRAADPGAEQRPPQPRVPVQRPARLRQDLQRPDPGPLDELRRGPDADPLRGVPVVHRPRPERSRLARRDRARRCVPRRRRRHPGPAREGAVPPGAEPVQDLHPRRGAHDHHGRVQRPAEAGRGAPGLRQVRLRHDRAGQGPADHPLAHPPLPVPAGAAAGAARAAGRGLRRARASTVDPLVLPLVVRAGGGSVRDSLSVLDQLLAGVGPRGGRLRPRGRAARLHRRRRCSTRWSRRSRPATAPPSSRPWSGSPRAGHDLRRFAADLLDRLRDLVVLDAVPTRCGLRADHGACGPARAG